MVSWFPFPLPNHPREFIPVEQVARPRMRGKRPVDRGDIRLQQYLRRESFVSNKLHQQRFDVRGN
jgi:hypothetical protein